MTSHINSIADWFKAAVPNPDENNQSIQLGVHLEEVTEMLDALGEHSAAGDLEGLAEFYKTGQVVSFDRKEFLDSLCDQIVTAVGVAHMFGLDISGALQEVNRSNWSKFVDGNPVFNKQGKIAKGQNYTPPNLEPFV